MSLNHDPFKPADAGERADGLDRWIARLHVLGHLPISHLRAFLRDTRAGETLSAAEETSLGWSIINDACPQSRERMLQTNIRLVAAIASRYLGRGVPLDVLIEEGSLGLRRAVDDFDPARGARFSTGASWWIKSAIRRVVRDPRRARSPAHVHHN